MQIIHFIIKHGSMVAVSDRYRYKDTHTHRYTHMYRSRTSDPDRDTNTNKDTDSRAGGTSRCIARQTVERNRPPATPAPPAPPPWPFDLLCLGEGDPRRGRGQLTASNNYRNEATQANNWDFKPTSSSIRSGICSFPRISFS